MNEYQVVTTTIEANLEIIKMIKTSDNKEKDIILISVLKELRNLCESIIPIFEQRLELKN